MTSHFTCIIPHSPLLQCPPFPPFTSYSLLKVFSFMLDIICALVLSLKILAEKSRKEVKQRNTTEKK